MFEALYGGRPITDARGISQEGVPIRQNVVPVFGLADQVIAVIIQKQNITEIVEQQRSIRSLERSNAYLSEMLLKESLSESEIPHILDEAIIFLDNEGKLRYANDKGRQLLESAGRDGTAEHALNSAAFTALTAEEQGGDLEPSSKGGLMELSIALLTLLDQKYK